MFGLLGLGGFSFPFPFCSLFFPSLFFPSGSNNPTKQTPSPHQPLLTPPPRYFSSKFHILDSLVILASFSTDVLLHGIVEEIASLVVILRLFRFFKIIEEFSVGAQEQMEGLQTQVEALERENGRLRLEVEGKGRGQGAADGTAGGEGLLV